MRHQQPQPAREPASRKQCATICTHDLRPHHVRGPCDDTDRARRHPLLTDPVLRDRIAYIMRIAPPPAADTVADLDAVLISHAHHDHLDVPSLRRIPNDVPVIAPPACAPLLRKSGHELIEVEAGTSVRVGSVDVLAIPAQHEGRRLPTDRRLRDRRLRDRVARVVLRRHGRLRRDGRARGATLDVALLPVWGWGPKVGPGHMDPERAARAAALAPARGSPCRSTGARSRVPASGGATTRRCRPAASRSSSPSTRRTSRCRSSRPASGSSSVQARPDRTAARSRSASTPARAGRRSNTGGSGGARGGRASPIRLRRD